MMDWGELVIVMSMTGILFGRHALVSFDKDPSASRTCIWVGIIVSVSALILRIGVHLANHLSWH